MLRFLLFCLKHEKSHHTMFTWTHVLNLNSQYFITRRLTLSLVTNSNVRHLIGSSDFALSKHSPSPKLTVQRQEVLVKEKLTDSFQTHKREIKKDGTN